MVPFPHSELATIITVFSSNDVVNYDESLGRMQFSSRGWSIKIAKGKQQWIERKTL